jgi:hypothetical protein
LAAKTSFLSGICGTVEEPLAQSTEKEVTLLLRIAAWLFIAEGAYDLFEVVTTLGGSAANLGAAQGTTLLLAGLQLATGIGLFGEDAWPRRLALFISGFLAVASAVLFVSYFSGPIGSLLAIMGLAAISVFQFGVVSYSIRRGD